MWHVFVGGDVCSVSFPHTACINVVSVCSEFHILFEERGWCQCVHSNAVGGGMLWLVNNIAGVFCVRP